MSVTHTFTGVDRNVRSHRNARKHCDRYVYSIWRKDGLGSLVNIEMPRGVEPVVPDLINLADTANAWRDKLLAANPNRVR